MDIIEKDFNYKIIKNFLSLNELDLLSKYCEIKHRLNLQNFDQSINTADSFFYGDPIIESLMISKKKLVEKETGKELLETYSFWRTYTKFAVLKKHSDRPSCEISVTVNIDNDGTDWPIYMDGKPVNINKGDGVVYLGCKLEHWRDEFKGDYQHQAFLHYVDKNGINKDHYLDKRKYFGIQK